MRLQRLRRSSLQGLCSSSLQRLRLRGGLPRLRSKRLRRLVVGRLRRVRLQLLLVVGSLSTLLASGVSHFTYGLHGRI